MALKKYGLTTPTKASGRVQVDRSSCLHGTPVKTLTEGQTLVGGRNNERITSASFPWRRSQTELIAWWTSSARSWMLQRLLSVWNSDPKHARSLASV